MCIVAALLPPRFAAAGIVLPCGLSAIAAIVYVVTVAAVSPVPIRLATVARVIGLCVAALVVVKFRPRTLLGALGCALPIGILALVVWLFRLV